MKKFIVTLDEDVRLHLNSLTSKGKHRSRKVLNALILLACDEGEHREKRSTNEEISRVLGISMRKIDRVKKRFVVDGYDVALNGRKGSRVYKKKVDGELEAHLGYDRWFKYLYHIINLTLCEGLFAATKSLNSGT